MRYHELFETILFEFKTMDDFRHQNIEDKYKFFGSTKKSDYINPNDGFHFEYNKGTLILSSTCNHNYSYLVHTGKWVDELTGKSSVNDIVRKGPESLRLWNTLEGKVDFAQKTITIAKEVANNKTRTRVIYDTKELQQALGNLLKYQVTDDFVVKGTIKPINGMTVGDIITMKGNVDNIITNQHPIMYHGTSMKRWDESIQYNGLQPGNTGDIYNDLIPGYSENNIYLATDTKTAEFYGKRQAKKDNDTQYVILEITVPDTAKLLPDDAFAYNLNKDNMYGKIKYSIKENGSLAYKGSIRKQFIKLLATRKG